LHVKNYFIGVPNSGKVGKSQPVYRTHFLFLCQLTTDNCSRDFQQQAHYNWCHCAATDWPPLQFLSDGARNPNLISCVLLAVKKLPPTSKMN